MKIFNIKGIQYSAPCKCIKTFFYSLLLKQKLKLMIPTEKQIAGNILISERLGAVKKFDNGDLYPKGYWDFNGEDWATDEQLLFHDDWNWLMMAHEALGFDDCSTNIEQAWNNLVDTLRAQSN